jgi:hypothetical protein
MAAFVQNAIIGRNAAAALVNATSAFSRDSSFPVISM